MINLEKMCFEIRKWLGTFKYKILRNLKNFKKFGFYKEIDKSWKNGLWWREDQREVDLGGCAMVKNRWEGKRVQRLTDMKGSKI